MINRYSKNEEVLKIIFDLAPNAILVVDSSGMVVFANPQVERIFGLPNRTINGMSIKDLMPLEFPSVQVFDQERFVTDIQASTSGQRIYILGVHAEGHSIPLEVQMHPISMNNDIFIITIAHDITHFKQVETDLRNTIERLSALNVQLEKINNEKNMLLCTAAHDLRSPLHYLLLATDLMINKCAEKGDDSLNVLSHMQQHIDYMSKLINNILEFSIIESGQIKLNLMRINIMDSILKSVDLNSTITAEKKIEVMVHGSREELPIILADPNRLLQVINNIMNNALKFAPESSKLNISAFSKGSGVEFSISDEGPGIALIDQQMIFQPFHSLSPSIDGKKSTGLGLAIVKRIVESHGGSVWVKSIKGHGSTFSVWIPTQQLLNDY